MLAEPAESRQTTPTIKAALGAAALVWELTGDQQVVLPVTQEGLGWATQPWGRMTAKRAIEVAGLLGPAAAPVVPELLPLLEDPELAPSVVRALTAVHPQSDTPASLPLTAMADRVLAAARPGTYASSALDILEALTMLGPAAFTTAQLDRIRELADGDRRIVGAGIQNRIITDDERFRDAARALLQTLTA